jgi:hypothetical protein
MSTTVKDPFEEFMSDDPQQLDVPEATAEDPDIVDERDVEEQEQEQKVQTDTVTEEAGNEDEDLNYFYFAKALGKKWGWSDDDINALKSEVDFNDEESFLAFIDNVIENSAESRAFASPEVQALNDFVKAGGTPRDFYAQYYAAPESYEAISPETLQKDAAMQERVYRALLESKNFKREKIEKLVKVAKEAEELEDFALDALEDLKALEKSKKEAIVQEQKKKQEEQQRQFEQQREGVKKAIESMAEIAGYQLTPKLKSELFDYLYKVDPKTGLTPRGAKYKQDPDLVLKVAFLEMKGIDKTKVESKEQTPAVRKLIEKLGKPSDASTRASSAPVAKAPTKAELLMEEFFS